MKNAVLYRGSWLMKSSQAYYLYEVWKKFGDNKDRKNLDNHMKELDAKYKALS